MPTATGWSPCRNSSLHLRQRKQRACPNLWRLFAARSVRVLRKHNLSRHRFNNLRNNPNLSRGNNSNHSNRVGLPSSRSKAGLNNPLNNRAGHARKHRWFNRPSAQAFTAVAVALDWTRTGDSVRCAVSRTWGIDGWSVRHERPLFEEDGLVKPDTGCS